MNRRWTPSAWKGLAAACLVAGVVKIGIALFLFSDLSCPSGCICDLPSSIYAYPMVCIFLGILWPCRSVQYMKLARNAPANAALTQFHRALNDGQTHASTSSDPSQLSGPSQVAIEVEGMPVSSDTHTNPKV
eukprot:CAMPEP_0118814114 /NCGR_PEP_ID=MMETSP1162-20130426/3376_1 /TAXON_ID=33656 /ORGANISM="Phaeocystis Sp, Strain CCMP2710" /LENGTH=131 /DNA_ID=CAMNT_0006743979 /DNA_START=418 /DNA_END=813 /DNA_ORIENTATION=-